MDSLAWLLCFRCSAIYPVDQVVRLVTSVIADVDWLNPTLGYGNSLGKMIAAFCPYHGQGA